MGQPTTTATMKLNISFPANVSQKLIEIEDDRKLRVFMDKRMGQEVPGDSVGDEFKGYIFKITGGNDKQGFPMKQGVMHPTRVRLLLSDGHSCYRPRRTGERKRKSVRGCIVAMDLSVLALSIVKQGDNDIPGITDTVHPKRLGPKRATKIRKFFGLTRKMMSASSLSVVRFSQRVRARSHTPRHQRSNVWLLLNVCNTSATASHSSAATLSAPRMLLTSTLQSSPSVSPKPRPPELISASAEPRRCASKAYPFLVLRSEHNRAMGIDCISG